MKRTFLLAGSLSLLGLASAVMPASAEQINSVNSLVEQSQADALGQVTSVSQLSDVQPTDWAFQAVQSLVERYGCIAGYPDGTFRGNRSATRYELAAALNACLDQISDRFATKEDLDAVKALQEEFAAELATLRGRVDGLEARTATLEAQQFSTTTKLQGEVVLAGQYGDSFSNPLGVDRINGVAVPDSRPSVLSRVRLNFNTSFSGDDLLQTQLEVGNGGQDFFDAAGLGAGGAQPLGVPGTLGFPGNVANNSALSLVDLGASDFSGVGNTVRLRRLAYSFKPFGEDLTLTVGSNLFPSDFVDFNSYANNSAQDFSSGFFINNPLIINNAVDFAGGAGGAFDWNVNGGPVTLRGTYVAANGGAAIEGGPFCAGIAPGAFGGDICAGGLAGDPQQGTLELEYADTFGSSDQSNFAVRLQYTRSDTFNVHQNVAGINAEATFGQFGVFGRAGVSLDPQVDNSDIAANVGGVNTDLIPAGLGDNTVLTWQAGVGVKDLLIPGSLLAVAGGQPFVVLGVGANNPDYRSQYNFEGFYRVPISENISLTPSVSVITNPFNRSDAGNNNSPVIQGLLRATFSF